MNSPEKVKNIVANFGLALWKAIDKKTFGFAKFEECPSIRDYDRDVRTVTNYSDIIEGNEDILVVHRLALSKEGLKLKDWLNAEGEDTLYTLFKRGNVPPELVTPYAIPFYKMDPKDQKAFQEWCLANGTPARKSAPGTPGHKGTPTITSLGAIKANENSPAVAPTRSLEEDLSNEQDE